jgi:hypothetical protein
VSEQWAKTTDRNDPPYVRLYRQDKGKQYGDLYSKISIVSMHYLPEKDTQQQQQQQWHRQYSNSVYSGTEQMLKLYPHCFAWDCYELYIKISMKIVIFTCIALVTNSCSLCTK